jgi:indole-3-glycerol phosphate synthase
MTDILEQIIANKRLEIQRNKALRPYSDLETAANEMESVRGFYFALEEQREKKGTAVIAECKKASPSKGLLRAQYNPADIAASYQSGGATCLSVLTDEKYFLGLEQDLAMAKSSCTLPILRKDFIIDPYQVIESRAIGADCILLIVACLDDIQLHELKSAADQCGLDTLIEVHDEEELERALKTESPLIGINNRDLKRFVTDINTTISLSRKVPSGRHIVTESGIRTPDDVEAIKKHNISSFLVGETFMRADDPGKKLQELFFR